MVTEKEIYNRQVEYIESPGNKENIFGLKSAHSYAGFLQGKINHFIKCPNVRYSGKDIEMMIRSFLEVYQRFHPQITLNVPIKNFKGKSGIEIQEYPTYFQTTQYRKTDDGIKTIRHKIPKYQLKWCYKAIQRQESNKKIHTRYIAQEYVKNANIEIDNKKRPYFDGTGFNFEQFVGNRSHYTPFNICLKILEHYGFIKYYKDGQIERLKDKLDIDIDLKEF